jgi:hypothetical protein
MGEYSDESDVVSGFETVEESMRAHYLDPSRQKDLRVYASELEAGNFAKPKELAEDAVSANGKCEWDKKKAFINRYKHGISFESVSLAFSDPPPKGFEILYDDPNDDGTGLVSFWGVDIRDSVIARIGGKGCALVKVDREHTHSRRVRIITAYPLRERAVMEAIKAHELNSSVSVLARSVVGSRRGLSASIRAAVDLKVKEYENIRRLTSLM